jgi:hypothetical protein
MTEMERVTLVDALRVKSRLLNSKSTFLRAARPFASAG